MIKVYQGLSFLAVGSILMGPGSIIASSESTESHAQAPIRTSSIATIAQTFSFPEPFKRTSSNALAAENTLIQKFSENESWLDSQPGNNKAVEPFIRLTRSFENGIKLEREWALVPVGMLSFMLERLDEALKVLFPSLQERLLSTFAKAKPKFIHLVKSKLQSEKDATEYVDTAVKILQGRAQTFNAPNTLSAFLLAKAEFVKRSSPFINNDYYELAVFTIDELVSYGDSLAPQQSPLPFFKAAVDLANLYEASIPPSDEDFAKTIKHARTKIDELAPVEATQPIDSGSQS